MQGPTPYPPQTAGREVNRATIKATETAEMAKLQILQQSTAKVMTQINQIPTLALNILTAQ